MRFKQSQLTRFSAALAMVCMTGCGGDNARVTLYQADETEHAQLSTALTKFFLEKAFSKKVTVNKGTLADANKALGEGTADVVAYASGPLSNGEAAGRLVQTGTIWKGQKFLRKEFKNDAKDVARFLDKMTFDDPLCLQDVLEWMNSEGATYDQAVIKLLDEKRSIWIEWLPEDRKFRVQEALRAEILDLQAKGIDIDS
jgi:ABC-type proline/glycine betaine transport system substrate-binding protein